MRYYISDTNHPKGFVEVTEDEYIALFGDETIRPYVSKVYCEELLIDEVPTELREAVQAVINNRINHWSRYEEAADLAEINQQYIETDLREMEVEV